MKILFLSDLIPIDDNEQCAKALVPIIKELQLTNSVDIIRPNFLFNSLLRGKKLKPNGLYEVNGIKIKNLNFHTPFLLKPNCIDISNYDKIIAHMPSGILFAQRLLKNCPKNQRPIVTYAVHQSDIQVLTSLKYAIYFKNKMKTAYKECDKIICRSAHLKEKLAKIMPECMSKTEVRISKIPPKYFISDAQMLDKIKPNDSIKFVTAANLIRRKNIDLIIKALAKFKDKNFSFEIIGDGKEKNNLIKLVKTLELENKITFCGKLPHDEVLNKMQLANVFILPSINETLGLVYLEAAAKGCLCIGTKQTGIDGIFYDNINCFLCEPTVNGVCKVLDKTFNLTFDDFKNLLLNRNLSFGEY